MQMKAEKKPISKVWFPSSQSELWGILAFFTCPYFVPGNTPVVRSWVIDCIYNFTDYCLLILLSDFTFLHIP
jgi:hypothetical protein